jgi:short-subunit dehydrogenase
MAQNQGTALVTGASSGIGAVYADRLARRGHDLILVARNAAQLEALASRLRAEFGRSVDVLPADLTDPAQLATVAERITAEGNLTLLVNNAGIALDGTLATTSAREVSKLIALNVTAPALLAQAALKAFQSKGAGQSKGAAGIINIASVLALAPEIMEGVYSGSKAFLLNLTQGLAHELGPDSAIRVQAVLPGATRTEIWERSGKDINAFPADWVMAVDDLVDAALLGFDRGETVTIPPLADEAGWTALNDARLALAPKLSRRDVAPRYRTGADA